MIGALLAIGLLVSTTPPVMALGDTLEARDCASAVDGDVRDSIINVICGLSPEELKELVAWAARDAVDGAEAATEARHVELLARLGQLTPPDSDFPVQAVAAILAVLGEEEVPLERLADTFAQLAEEHLELKHRLRTLESDDPEVQALREQAAAALDEGAHDLARVHLEAARGLVRAKREALKEAPAAQSLEEAQLVAEQGDVERARLAHSEAAALYEEAAALTEAFDPAATRGYLGQAADILYYFGKYKGDNAALARSIALRGEILAGTERAVEPLDWALAQMKLGIALKSLGEREPGTARLEEAVAAFRLALKERTRDRVPLDWAMTQMNLGNALASLGEREPGTARLEEAVAAYRLALEEFTRDRAPLDWARTQMNLGNALMRLGEREPGTARLEEAVAAFRLALEEFARDRVPHEWARTQMSLGAALQILGEREPSTARIQGAIAAYRLALGEFTRDRVPLDWAQTQMNLGLALRFLGEREPGTARLEEALAALRLALEERTRDRVPLEWAFTRFNMGIVFFRLGERRHSMENFEEAQRAFQDGAVVLEAAGHPAAVRAAAGVKIAQEVLSALADREAQE